MSLCLIDIFKHDLFSQLRYHRISKMLIVGNNIITPMFAKMIIMSGLLGRHEVKRSGRSIVVTFRAQCAVRTAQ